MTPPKHEKRLHSTPLVICLCLLAFAWGEALASPSAVTPASEKTFAQLAPFGLPASAGLHPDWILDTLPQSGVPSTQFDWMVLGQERALRVQTNSSYGLIRHPWRGAHPLVIRWRWRLDQALTQADLKTKQGDDAAIKICLMFDQALEDIPLWERLSLQLARQVSDKPLPSATLCYVWDKRYAVGHQGHNPYTARVRYIVVDDDSSPQEKWIERERNVAQDFALLFGSETRGLPPVTAVVVGADSDNTQGRSLAYVQSLHWVFP